MGRERPSEFSTDNENTHCDRSLGQCYARKYRYEGGQTGVLWCYYFPTGYDYPNSWYDTIRLDDWLTLRYCYLALFRAAPSWTPAEKLLPYACGSMRWESWSDGQDHFVTKWAPWNKCTKHKDRLPQRVVLVKKRLELLFDEFHHGHAG